MGVRLAEQLGNGAEKSIAQEECARNQTRPSPPMGEAGDQGQDCQQDDSLQSRLVELARMARQLQAVGGKHNGPRDVAGPAVKFAVDEIGDAPEK